MTTTRSSLRWPAVDTTMAACVTFAATFCLASACLVAQRPSSLKQGVLWEKGTWFTSSGAAVSWSPADGRVIYFGGSGGRAGDETRAWTGARWVKLPSPNKPPARWAHRMAPHMDAGHVVLCGGKDRSGFLHADTWTWDGGGWRQRIGPGPDPREGHSMCWDPAGRRVVLFGGVSFRASRVFDDTWVWDGSSWTQLPTRPTPGPRFDSAIGFHGGWGLVVLVGGRGHKGRQFHDLWVLIGDQWHLLSPSIAPLAHTGMRLATDPVSGDLILHGGQDASGAVLDETWALDVGSWRRLAGPYPPARVRFGMAQDPSAGTILLFGGGVFDGGVFAGGVLGGGVFGDVWELDRRRWTRLLDVVAPGSNNLYGLAYDPRRDQAVMLGGQRVGDYTWIFSGGKWQVLVTTPSPQPRWGFGIAHDEGRGRIVLFGGVREPFTVLDDTWEWDGSTWTQAQPATLPLPRFGYAMATNPGGGVVMFGGLASFPDGYRRTVNETWIWDGNDWREVPGNPWLLPHPRHDAMMVYDEHRRRAVLFGGNGFGYESDTWEWDGARWEQKQIPLAERPPARAAAAMAYDGARRVVVLHGGRNPDWSPRGDTWEYDGVRWRERFPTQRGPASFENSMVYLANERRLLLFGGRVDALPGRNPRDDSTWFYRPEAPADYEAFGAGCPGTGGTLDLRLDPDSELPWTGSRIDVRVGSLQPGQTGAMLLGASKDRWGSFRLPLGLGAIGMPGCDLLVSLELATPFVAAGTAATWSATICACSEFVGASFYNQAVVLDPGANLLGAVVSNGGQATIGAK